MSTETNEGLTPERVEALIERLNDPLLTGQNGPLKREAAATIAELRAEVETASTRHDIDQSHVEAANQRANELTERLERKDAALREESARLNWLEAENADIEANRSGIEIGGWYGASGRSLREQIDSARALTSTPEGGERQVVKIQGKRLPRNLLTATDPNAEEAGS